MKRDVKFNTHFDQDDTRKGETNTGPTIVETDTYVPFKRQIEDIIDAGARKIEQIRKRNLEERAQMLLMDEEVTN